MRRAAILLFAALLAACGSAPRRDLDFDRLHASLQALATDPQLAKLALAEKELQEAKKGSSISVGKVTNDTKKGTARLGIEVPQPGSLVVSGPGIKKVSGHPTGPGEVQVLIKAKGKALKALKQKGKVTVEVTIKLSGPNGTGETTTKVTLVKK